jgi:BlaI family transcriptional regulator, penicillinase repressor
LDEPNIKEGMFMARPPAKDLTQRELEVMHAFWKHGKATPTEARDRLAAAGLDRAYTTVATLVRILLEKGFLRQTNAERPFCYEAARSYEEVSGRLLSDVVRSVFRGSREQLLVRLVEQRALTAKERAVLEDILKEQSR